MGALLVSAVVINRPIAEVFAYVLDLESSFKAFDPGVESVDRTPSGPIGAGTEFTLWQTVFGRRLSAKVLYTAVEMDRTIEFEAWSGPLATAAVFRFDTEAGATSIRFRGDARPTGPFNVLSPLLKAVIGRVWRTRLRRLKTMLESRAT